MYNALEKAQEILNRAFDSGYFDGCESRAEAQAKAEWILGDEFSDVDIASCDRYGVVAQPGYRYRPQGRASAAFWLPEEKTC